MRPGGSSARTLRVAIIAASALALAAVAAILLTAGTGGTGADEIRLIWSDSDTLVETATVITDFDPSEDSLRISVDQAVFSGDVTPVLNEVGGNTEVIVQGERVAVLQGTTGLTQGDLRVDYY